VKRPRAEAQGIWAFSPQGVAGRHDILRFAFIPAASDAAGHSADGVETRRMFCEAKHLMPRAVEFSLPAGRQDYPAYSAIKNGRSATVTKHYSIKPAPSNYSLAAWQDTITTNCK